jgi:hypothetical protein
MGGALDGVRHILPSPMNCVMLTSSRFNVAWVKKSGCRV